MGENKEPLVSNLKALFLKKQNSDLIRLNETVYLRKKLKDNGTDHCVKIQPRGTYHVMKHRKSGEGGGGN